MTHVVERLAELRTYLDHLATLRQRVTGPELLRQDLTLRNDLLFSLLTVAQLVIDIAGEIGGRRGLRFENYTEAVRNMARMPEFDAALVERLAPLPGFPNVLVHDYVVFDLERAVVALRDLEPVEEFHHIVSGMQSL